MLCTPTEAQIFVPFALRWAVLELHTLFRKSAQNEPKWPWWHVGILDLDQMTPRSKIPTCMLQSPLRPKFSSVSLYDEQFLSEGGLWTNIDSIDSIRQGLHQATVRDLVSNYPLISLGHLNNKSIVSNSKSGSPAGIIYMHSLALLDKLTHQNTHIKQVYKSITTWSHCAKQVQRSRRVDLSAVPDHTASWWNKIMAICPPLTHCLAPPPHAEIKCPKQIYTLHAALLSWSGHPGVCYIPCPRWILWTEWT